MTQSTINEVAFSTNEEAVLKYLIRGPKANAKTRKAIVLLHGVGSNEKDLFSLSNQLFDDLIVMSARGPIDLGVGRYAWYQVDFSTGKPVINAEQEASSREKISLFIDEVKQKYNLDEVYLGGFSQGAIMSFNIGLTHPVEVKGIVALSGRIIDQIRPYIQKNALLQQLRVFVAHGLHDNMLPIHYAKEAKEFLQSLGVQLSYHEYPIGHQVHNEVLNDIRIWMNI
jgi:phospholipase/carboxylesterase